MFQSDGFAFQLIAQRVASTKAKSELNSLDAVERASEYGIRACYSAALDSHTTG